MPNCRLCGISENQTIRSEHVYGGTANYKFYECSSCGAIYLYPPLNDEEEKHFYKKEFEKFMSSRSGTERDWTNAEKHIDTNQDQVTRRLKYLMPYIKPGVKILEIGCSTGFMLDAFMDLGAECVGVEPSGEFLPFLLEKGYRAYESLEDFMAQNPDEKFDLVVHFFVFEHIRNPLEFLNTNIGCLKNGGIVIAEIPSATDPLVTLYKIEAFEKFYWSIAHHYYYTPKSLKYILEQIPNIRYEILPEQRYDLSNHITWLMEGKPGGQGRFEVFGSNTLRSYSEDLKQSWLCDTVILSIKKEIDETNS